MLLGQGRVNEIDEYYRHANIMIYKVFWFLK